MILYIISLTICISVIIITVIYLRRKKKTLPYDVMKSEAEKGNREAQTLLGFMYYSGKDTVQDISKAAYWFEKAAEKGSGEAAFLLGGILIEGKSIAQDSERGVKLISFAAEKGFTAAQTALGNMYATGSFVKQDVNESVKWFMLAAAGGDVIAQKTVAGIYNFTVGFDRKMAYAWYMAAASSGDIHAKEMSESLFAEFSESERVIAAGYAEEAVSKYSTKTVDNKKIN